MNYYGLGKVNNLMVLASYGDYTTLSYAIQLSMILILLINVKMPTIVGILAFISRINITSQCFKAGKIFICFIILLFMGN